MNNMFNKIKKFICGEEKEGLVIEPVSERKLDISEPIYTIVQKIKDNPKRLKFTLIDKSIDKSNALWEVKDIVTGYVCCLKKISTYHLMRYGCCNIEGGYKILLADDVVILTLDENKYIIENLKPLYSDRYNKYNNLIRERRIKNIAKEEKRKREELLKIWED